MVSTNQEKGIFFRTTRKRLERLAENKESIGQADNAKDTILDKTPITETYINYTRYELEKLGFVLIRVDKTYLVCVAEDLHRIRLLSKDNMELYSVDEKELDAKVKSFIESRKNKASKENDKDKPIAENNEVALKDIWSTLVTHIETCLAAYTENPEQLALTYEQLTDMLKYKAYRNGLASFLYSIEEYCKGNGLPKLNYLVVKEANGLPDGFKNADIEAFKGFSNELKEITEFVKNGELSESPDIDYIHKARPKKSS